MKTQISRHTHRPGKRYSGVYQQQGRMITDADWNELVDILKERLRGALQEVVGNGVPHLSPLKVTADLKLQPGTVYVDGIRGVLAGDAPLLFTAQPDFPHAPALPSDAVVYVDLWERAVVALEDGELRDPGLHGADTCSRTQTMLQVKWCDPAAFASLSTRTVGSASLDFALPDNSATSELADPCLTDTIEQPRIGNYLFRVEVHQVRPDATGNRVDVTFKWSSENAAEQYSLLWRDDIGVEHRGYDQLPREFTTGHWTYEVYNDTSERHLGLHLAKDFSPASGVLLDTLGAMPPSIAVDSLSEEPQYVRRWDGHALVTLRRPDANSPWTVESVNGKDKGQTLRVTTPFLPGQLIASFEGLRATFHFPARTTFLAGDYWLAVVREGGEYVEDAQGAPVVDRRVERLGDGKPLGVEHHYLELARITGGHLQPYVTGSAEERKLDFPPLTNLVAERIGYDPVAAGNRWDDINDGPRRPLTVQEALDDLANNLESSDVSYVLPECATTSYNAPSLLSHLQPHILHQVTGSDGKTRTKVEDLWNALLCLLDAGQLPYNPATSAALGTRWDEVNASGTGQRPTSIQQAVDDLLQTDSTDLRYTLPACSAGHPSLRRSLPSVRNLADGSNLYVAQALTALLCETRASHLPLDWEAVLSPVFPAAGAENVQQALNVLASRPTGSCSSTVGNGGQYPTLQAAFADLAGKLDISLCLLPGVYDLGTGLKVIGKRNIRITGTGAAATRITWSDSFYLDADEVTLSDLTLDAGPTAELYLSASTAVAEHNVIRRTIAHPFHVWSKSFDASGVNEWGYCVKTDSGGNVYVLGTFGGTINFGGANLVAAGTADIFLAKFDRSGGHLWSRNFGGGGLESFPRMVLDAYDNIILAGHFQTSISFGGPALTMNSTATGIFAAKLDRDGHHLWSRLLAETSSTMGIALAVDIFGDCYFSGWVQATGVPSPKGAFSTTGNHLFKADRDGHFLWHLTLAGTPSTIANNLATDYLGNVFVTGVFTGTANFGGATLTSAGGQDIFLVKFSPDGLHRWSRSFGTPGYEGGLLLATDPVGRVVLTASVQSPIDFGGGALSGTSGSVVAKFDADGNHLWSKRLQGQVSPLYDGCTVDHRGDTWLTGKFYGPANLGGADLAAAYMDMFLLRLDADGNHLFSRQFSATGLQEAFGLSVDRDGNVICVGSFTGTMTLGTDTFSASGLAAFVTKLAPDVRPLVSVGPRYTGGASELSWTDNQVQVPAQDPLQTALALRTHRVGGRLSDNTIEGEVFLMHSFPAELESPLRAQYGTVSIGGGADLFIRGNRIRKLRSRYESSAPNLAAYQSLVVTDNVFREPANSFIGYALTLNNNQFATTSVTSYVALAATTRAIVVGNQAGRSDAFLTLISADDRESANLFNIRRSHLSFFYPMTHYYGMDEGFMNAVGADLL